MAYPPWDQGNAGKRKQHADCEPRKSGKQAILGGGDEASKPSVIATQAGWPVVFVVFSLFSTYDEL
ncbi:MAG: hypothetical protein L0Z07_03325, partial [Planctomycetes bacterium]|nr:hypothetical protein [Planctomycetota bacterium]